MRKVELSGRKEKILSAVIERFTATGEPVGSKFLASVLPVAVSPATVRNDMAYLSEKGFLIQPHTSAGRVPSDKGYRYYIERLLQSFTPSDSELFRIASGIDRTQGEADIILSQVCEVLSSLTGCAAAATPLMSDGAVIKSTQVVPISRHSAMVVAVTSAGAVKSRMARLETELEYPLIELFYSVAAANFTGTPAEEFTKARLQSVTASLGAQAFSIMPLLISLYEAVQDAASPGVVVKGQSNILSSAAFSDSAAQIMELLRNGDEMSRLLKMRGGADIELKIGAENEYSCLRRAALIKAAYSVKDAGRGCVAVIGPTKMDYSRVIPLVKYISSLTGSIVSLAVDSCGKEDKIG